MTGYLNNRFRLEWFDSDGDPVGAAFDGFDEVPKGVRKAILDLQIEAIEVHFPDRSSLLVRRIRRGSEARNGGDG